MIPSEMIVEGVKRPEKLPRYIAEKINRRRGKRWIDREIVYPASVLGHIDGDLFEETRQYCSELDRELNERHNGLKTSDFHDEIDSGGGGAACDIAYFFTRYEKPETVVETGVAAGWSSRAILDALEANSGGRLISNDLPYAARDVVGDRLGERNIGVLVDGERRNRWELHLGPDEVNLPKIASSVDSIDIFHYDSDKSYPGRRFAMETIRRKLHDSSLVIMDDVADNTFFRDFVSERELPYDVVRSTTTGTEVGLIFGDW